MAEIISIPSELETELIQDPRLDEHLAASNPHDVTKSQIGLGSVNNYDIASKAQAEAGSVNNVYMTPLRVKEAIDKLANVFTKDFRPFTFGQTTPVQNTWYTALDISGNGLLNVVHAKSPNNKYLQLRITVDGVVKNFTSDERASYYEFGEHKVLAFFVFLRFETSLKIEARYTEEPVGGIYVLGYYGLF